MNPGDIIKLKCFFHLSSLIYCLSNTIHCTTIPIKEAKRVEEVLIILKSPIKPFRKSGYTGAGLLYASILQFIFPASEFMFIGATVEKVGNRSSGCTFGHVHAFA
jgi:hypothetical protein